MTSAAAVWTLTTRGAQHVSPQYVPVRGGGVALGIRKSSHTSITFM